MKKIILNFKFQVRLSVAAFIFSVISVLIFSKDENVIFTVALMCITAVLCLLPSLDFYRQTKKLEKYRAVLYTFYTIMKGCQKTIQNYLEPGSIIPPSKTLDDLIKALDNRDLWLVQKEFESL